jgi:hypothetical protein
MESKRATTFYCFSPPVMVTTFAIELGLLLYTLVRYKMSPIVRVVSAALLCLAVFQLAEYNICQGVGLPALTWAQIGFVAITMLPPLGIHLFQLISGQKSTWLTGTAYGSGVFWAIIFGTGPWAFNGPACAGNYIIFDLASPIEYGYVVYYYLWLFIGMWLCVSFARRAKRPVRAALLWLLVGYMIFVVPTAVVNTLNPVTMEGIPSIMCGFAVTLAVVLVFKILPLRTHSKSYTTSTTI